jgi:hypothetical protein
MSEEFDDDAQEIPAAAVPKNYLINPKLLVVLVVLVALIPTHSLQCLSFRPFIPLLLQVIFGAFCIWAKRKHDQREASVSASFFLAFFGFELC